VVGNDITSVSAACMYGSDSTRIDVIVFKQKIPSNFEILFTSHCSKVTHRYRLDRDFDYRQVKKLFWGILTPEDTFKPKYGPEYAHVNDLSLA
jgi:hypothetical protein